MREDWVEVELVEVSLLNPKIKDKSEIDPDLEVQFVPMKLVDEVVDHIHLVETRVFGEVSKGSYTYFEEGDVLFAKVTPCMENGKIAVAKNLKNSVGYGSSEFHVFRPSQALNRKYLFFYIVRSRFRNEAQHAMTGAVGLRRVPKIFLENYKISLAPLPEQRAIVAKIEALFSELDSGIQNLKTAQAQLKIYRQAVLKKAFEGGLSGTVIGDDEDDGQDLSIAAEPESPYRHDHHKNQDNHSADKKKLPKGWKWVNSGELFSFVTSGSRGWAKYYSDSGAIFIRITNLNFETLELDLRDSKIQYVKPPDGSEGLRTRVQEGDFLFSITGYLGMFAIAPNLEDAYVNQHVSLCRPKEGFNRKYVGYWIISKVGGFHYLNKNQKGAVKAGLNLDDLKSFPVPMPEIGEQIQIVQEIESRLSVCDKMEESITESLQKAESLRQSILKKAFEGKLLSEAELSACRKEADWEPARKLVERVRNQLK